MTKSGAVDPKGRRGFFFLLYLGSQENRKDQLSMVSSILCNFWQAASRLFLQHEEKNVAGSHEYFLLKEERFQNNHDFGKTKSLYVFLHSIFFFLALSTYSTSSQIFN